MENVCPICKSKHYKESGPQPCQDWSECKCENCGTYVISGSVMACLPGKLTDVTKAAVLSHVIWKMQASNRPPELTEDLIESILKNQSLLSPREIIDEAILFIGHKHIHSPGHWFGVGYDTWPAKIGATGPGDVGFVIQQMRSAGVLEKHDDGIMEGRTTETWRLTFKGWERYEELRRGISESRRAFMAMPFRIEKVKRAYECFKKAATEAGFELSNPLLDVPTAGSIDDRLRVEIRTARFLIADLTENNLGAYWEAGFAEGLGKKVIYTCEENFFPQIHFDTNHLQTVKWSEDELDKAAEELKAVIRNTFPADAKMTDD